VARRAPRPLTRAQALQCLLALASLPYARLHPVRADVVRALAPVLDDPRRAVRQAAVRVRNRWALLGGSADAVLP
jgi:DNA repair/transcription protein MET18/MMS19